MLDSRIRTAHDDSETARVVQAPVGAASVIIVAAALFWLVFSYGYIEDDAFIHLEFARSVSEGRGFSFNGQLVNGDTAPLWVLLLCLVHALGLQWIAAAKLLCACGIALALSGVWRLTEDLASLKPRQRYLVPLALLVTAFNPYFVHWSFAGMESVAALGVSLWAIWAVFSTSDTSWPRIAVAALLLALSPLIRPELMLLVVVLAPALLFQAWRLSSAAPLFTSPPLLIVSLLAGLIAAPTVLWSAYALHALGSIMPNTNAAKRGGDFVAVATRLGSVYMLGFAATLVALPFVAARLMRSDVPRVIWILLLWPLLCALFYLADHTAVQTRYCLLSMPSLCIAVLWLLGETVTLPWVQRVAAGMMITSAAIIVLIVYPHVSNKLKVVKSISDAAMFVRDTLPPSAPIAIYGIGQFAFESRHPLVDIGGITRPGVIPYLGDLPAAIRWAEGQGAQYYVGGESPGPSAVRVYSYPEPFLGWSLHRSNYDNSTTTGIFRLNTP